MAINTARWWPGAAPMAALPSATWITTPEKWSAGVPARPVRFKNRKFVPRRPDSPEGDRYPLTVVNRLAENHSDLAVLDAHNVTGLLKHAILETSSGECGNWPTHTCRTNTSPSLAR
jgi:hypothetical protein